MHFKSDLGRRAASSWALPHISSFFLFVYTSHRVLTILLTDYDARWLIQRAFRQGIALWGCRWWKI